ncbi:MULTISPECIES: 30S ribosomal protein S6 [unclassified Mycoplasma]|uniref:30S ribosomal protein S6 n=1 Tax=unclassified Mycoplasma TaxID=2683645 RepID=UPI00211C3E30|nr:MULTISPECIES: 30S ribosomal protein S6 [unclassified Mycoplasma]UUM19590.1 30S ribosomal protein S6 [Mycoplasma sp. 1578d]UUM24510.1 30S ribosomal protein S6 [Mycoplasma sp. 3686d]
MTKYEIMMIVDPKANLEIAQKLLVDVFEKKVTKVEKLERTELAYKINNAQNAQYLLAQIECESTLVSEFTRKANIVKEIWRYLVLNLDTERGFNKEFKNVGKKKVDPRVKRERTDRSENSSNEENKKRTPRPVRAPKPQE